MSVAAREACSVRRFRVRSCATLLLATLPPVAAADVVGIDASIFWLLVSVMAITGLAALFVQQRMQRRLDRAERGLQRAVSEQREAERRYRLLAAHGSELIWTMSLGTPQFTYLSPALERLCQFAPSSMQNRPPEELCTLESAALLSAEHARLSRQAGDASIPEVRFELELRCADGTAIWTDTRLGVLRDESGTATAIYGVVSDMTEQRKLRARLDFLAHHDALTGLPNRMLFFDRLERAVAAARRDGTRLALLYLDLDGFKEINDSLGHPAGDTLLMQVALRLSASVRDSDTVARMGGDEFTVILRTVRDAPSVARITEKILTALSEPIAIDAQRVRIGVSIGASQFPEHGDQVGTLVALADAAMARSKRGGRNRWSMAIPDTPVLKSVPVEAPPAETPPPEGAGSVRPVLAAVRNPLSES